MARGNQRQRVYFADEEPVRDLKLLGEHLVGGGWVKVFLKRFQTLWD
jgi:hypothetical protein